MPRDRQHLLDIFQKKLDDLYEKGHHMLNQHNDNLHIRSMPFANVIFETGEHTYRRDLQVVAYQWRQYFQWQQRVKYGDNDELQRVVYEKLCTEFPTVIPDEYDA